MSRKDVVMLEAREVCWGATGRNGGHCYPIYFDHPHDPSIGRFELANFNTIRNLVNSRGIDCEFKVQAGVRAIYSPSVFASVKSAVEVLSSTAPDLAAELQVFDDVDDLARLRVPKAAGAVVSATAARMWPYKFVARILEDLLTTPREDGGSFNLQTHTPVTSLAPLIPDEEGEARWVVQTPRGSVRARTVVLATNAYTSHLLPHFADLIVPVRGHMAALIPPASMASENVTTTSFGFLEEGRQDSHLIQRTAQEQELLLGGGRELAPSVGIADDSVVVPEVARYLRSMLLELLGPKVGDRPTVPEASAAADPQTGGTAPELAATHEWTGIWACSRDGMPWVGPVSTSAETRRPGLFLSAAYTGHGMPNAWLCGKEVVSMVVRPEADSGGSETLADAAVAGLPAAYAVTEERIRRARGMESVAKVDELGATRPDL
ncbi:hypothetical protein LTR66_014649 [Elasticomyces elasticus]|nr:hypothetical protein LTR66_014649 [Elasticomyces elasticus]